MKSFSVIFSSQQHTAAGLLGTKAVLKNHTDSKMSGNIYVI
jgi:hypothetical protein